MHIFVHIAHSAVYIHPRYKVSAKLYNSVVLCPVHEVNKFMYGLIVVKPLYVPQHLANSQV